MVTANPRRLFRGNAMTYTAPLADMRFALREVAGHRTAQAA